MTLPWSQPGFKSQPAHFRNTTKRRAERVVSVFRKSSPRDLNQGVTRAKRAERPRFNIPASAFSGFNDDERSESFGIPKIVLPGTASDFPVLDALRGGAAVVSVTHSATLVGSYDPRPDWLVDTLTGSNGRWTHGLLRGSDAASGRVDHGRGPRPTCDRRRTGDRRRGVRRTHSRVTPTRLATAPTCRVIWSSPRTPARCNCRPGAIERCGSHRGRTSASRSRWKPALWWSGTASPIRRLGARIRAVWRR